MVGSVMMLQAGSTRGLSVIGGVMILDALWLEDGTRTQHKRNEYRALFFIDFFYALELFSFAVKKQKTKT